MRGFSLTKKTGFSVLFVPLIAFLAFSVFIIIERAGVRYNVDSPSQSFVPEQYVLTEKPEKKERCLLIINSAEESSPHEHIEFVLTEMCESYRLIDVAVEEIPPWNNYETVVLSVYDLDAIRGDLMTLLDWVEGGGRLMLAESPWSSTTLNVIAPKLGMLGSDWELVPQIDAIILTDFMPGGKGLELAWSTSEEDDLRYGLNINVDSDSIVHIKSTGGAETAMLWERKCGAGKIVVFNNNAAFDKWFRGMIAAAYSLLDDAIAWPVINSSLFFIDDFPSPVPEGDSEYITRDYGVSIENFYVNIWFPDMLSLAQRYGLKYTGMIIETYGDNIEPPFDPVGDPSRFNYFGNILLAEGFEIGLHGYNHMPLVLEDFDYAGLLDYSKWRTVDDMTEAVREALRFSQTLYPDVELKTYIPPSNVWASETRNVLKSHFSNINVISALYVDDYYENSQEFGVGEDGIIDLPRLSVGYSPTDYDMWIVLNELSLHYINSHFIHPDDTLDPERGAETGWEVLKKDFEEYIKWLNTSAPGLRNMTAQDGAKAVQRFSNLYTDTKTTEHAITIDITGLYDEAWLLVRINTGSPSEVTGGELTQLCDTLYLLRAVEKNVIITLES